MKPYVTALGVLAAIAVGAPHSSAASEAARLAQKASFDQRLPVIQSASKPVKERLEALHSAFRVKESLSEVDQINLLSATTSIATNRHEDARLRTDSIWAMSGTAMLLRHNKVLSASSPFWFTALAMKRRTFKFAG